MRPLGFSAARSRLIATIPLIALASQAAAIRVTNASSDPCSWITQAQLQKMFGQSYAAPEQSVALAPYPGQPSGTHCNYVAQQPSAPQVTLIAYVDSSTAIAKATFQKLTTFYAPTTPVSGIGDVAYLDRRNAIHVLKGTTRYFISISDAGSQARASQLRVLATQVAAQL